MVSRADAVTAKEAMEKNRAPDSQLRASPTISHHCSWTNFKQTRWGVGFGPRDCSDYQTGVSIIPISKLTDADRKWMLTAEYGGSGGAPIEPGMVVEEPDIEIGQGVSSKAISRRMQTDKGGNNGPKSSRDREEDDGPRYRRGDRDDRRDNRRDDDRKDRFPAVSGPPAMPSIPPFGMPGFPPFPMPTLSNGMPMLPPGFVFPGQTQPQQPPPPGHRT
jgi:protein NRD1